MLKASVNTAITAMLLSVGVFSCSRDQASAGGGNMALVSVGDTTLTLSDVTSRIPAGLTPEDSISLLSSIVENWMQDALLKEMAEENTVDMERIDRMTKDYRNRLIINEYMRQMERAKLKPASDKEVKEVYEAQGSSLVTESPLVKGIYIKMPSDASRLADVRRWMKSASRSSLENIEKYGAREAVEYDCFTTRWVDWNDIATQIPHAFGNPDQFLQGERDFEMADRTSTYFVHISEVLPSGSAMPYDFAATRIRESLNQRRRSVFARELVSKLAEQARKEGRLSTPGYDLQTHRVKIEQRINNTKDIKK